MVSRWRLSRRLSPRRGGLRETLALAGWKSRTFWRRLSLWPGRPVGQLHHERAMGTRERSSWADGVFRTAAGPLPRHRSKAPPGRIEGLGAIRDGLAPLGEAKGPVLSARLPHGGRSSAVRREVLRSLHALPGAARVGLSMGQTERAHGRGGIPPHAWSTAGGTKGENCPPWTRSSAPCPSSGCCTEGRAPAIKMT